MSGPLDTAAADAGDCTPSTSTSPTMPDLDGWPHGATAAMNTDTNGLRHDIAFLRALAEGGENDRGAQRGTGEAFVAAGVLYAAQCFATSGQVLGFGDLSETAMLLVSSVPTVLFLVAITVISVRNRQTSPGVVSRALSAAFGAAGAATLAMLCVFLIAVWRNPSLETWMIYPCTVFALQGAAWLVAWNLRRRAWLCAVAFGWLVSAVVLAASIGSPWYPVVAGVALLLLMAVPGAYMLRRQPG